MATDDLKEAIADAAIAAWMNGDALPEAVKEAIANWDQSQPLDFEPLEIPDRFGPMLRVVKRSDANGSNP